ncbi:MAG: hypothetical protein AAGC92_01210 [Pseudomonadota bacterium]
MIRLAAGLFPLFLAAPSAPTAAGEVEITAVSATENNGRWRFEVTLRHGDTGWDHYADAWELRLRDGTVLGTRTLFHPHVDEQPFTRSLGGVQIPPGVDIILVFARDSVHGWTEEPVFFEIAD